MKKNIYPLFILLFALVISLPDHVNALPQKNSHDFLAQCLGNIKPPDGSKTGEIFEQIVTGTNPTISGEDVFLLKEWIKTKQPYIKLLDQAIEIDHIIFPPIDMKIDATLLELPSFYQYKNLITLKLVQAKIHLHDSHQNKAIYNVLDVIKIGKMIRYGERNTILNYMVGAALEGIGINWLQNLLCLQKYDNEILTDVLEMIRACAPRDDAFILAMEGELNGFAIPYLTLYLNKVEEVLTQLKINHKPIYSRSDIIKFNKIQFQKTIDNAKVPWPDRAKSEVLDSNNKQEIFTSENEPFLDLVSGDMLNGFDINNKEHVAQWEKLVQAAEGTQNFIGKLLNSTSIYFDNYYQRSVQLRTTKNITRTLVALIIFQNNHGHLPENLNSLVETKILDKVPLDLFSNQPLAFSFDDEKLWSTGCDEINDQGDQEKDIVISCGLLPLTHPPKLCE